MSVSCKLWADGPGLIICILSFCVDHVHSFIAINKPGAVKAVGASSWGYFTKFSNMIYVLEWSIDWEFKCWWNLYWFGFGCSSGKSWLNFLFICQIEWPISMLILKDVDLESADGKKHARGSTLTKRSRAAEVHNLSERVCIVIYFNIKLLLCSVWGDLVNWYIANSCAETSRQDKWEDEGLARTHTSL